MKYLYKFTENYFLGIEDSNNRQDILYIFSGNEYHFYPTLEIDIKYSAILNMLNRDDIYSNVNIILDMASTTLLIRERDVIYYYNFVNEMIREYDFDLSNFTFDLMTLVLSIVKNLVFV